MPRISQSHTSVFHPRMRIRTRSMSTRLFSRVFPRIMLLSSTLPCTTDGWVPDPGWTKRITSTSSREGTLIISTLQVRFWCWWIIDTTKLLLSSSSTCRSSHKISQEWFRVLQELRFYSILVKRKQFILHGAVMLFVITSKLKFRPCSPGACFRQKQLIWHQGNISDFYKYRYERRRKSDQRKTLSVMQRNHGTRLST